MTKIVARPKAIKYLSNKELLAEIARCKKTFCTFIAPEYSDYDAILTSEVSASPLFIEELLDRLNSKLDEGESPKTANGLIFRVMTYDHIPLDPDRKRKSRATNQSHARTNFPPFKHYLFNVSEDGTETWTEVGRSHWKGDFETGEFTVEKGRMSERLGMMFVMLVDKYSSRSNWRGYSYRDEMRGLALTHLAQVGLQFDESKSNNPFAFFTTTITHCLGGETMILTKEHGSIAIQEVAEMDVHLLDGNGEWVKCHIYDHGIQETQLNYFQQGGRKEEVWSTLEHGWVSKGEKITTADFEGHNVIVDDIRPSKVIKNEESYRRGVVHGMVYGDGSNERVAHAASIRLCGEKDELSPWLSDFKYTTPVSSDHEKVYHIKNCWADFKKFPKDPSADSDYLLGFLRGWVATDGCVADGAATPTLCGDEAEYDWLAKWGPVVGWAVNGFTTLNPVTNYGARNKASLNFHLRKSSLCSEDFLRTKHKERWDNRRKRAAGKSQGLVYDWAKVEEMKAQKIPTRIIAETLGYKQTALASAYCQYRKAKAKSTEVREWNVINSAQPEPRQRRRERVYCPVVPTTGNFSLSSHILSFNCFTRTLNIEKKNQSIRDDLLIHMGMSPSSTRQIADELAQSGVVEPKALPGKRGRKSAVALAAIAKAEASEKADK